MKTFVTIARIVFVSLLVLHLYPGHNLFAAEAIDPEQQYDQLPVFATDAKEGFPFLLEKMKGRRAYLLGDASHGTEEFYSFRKWVTRNLIREQGVRVWVLEAEWDSAKMVDAYIRGLLPEDTEARQMLAEAFFRWPRWVWANEELAEFVVWLKDFNSRLKPEQMVHCYGMDMQMAVQASLEFLATRWSADSLVGQKYLELYNWWQPYLNDPVLFNHAYAKGSETGSLLATELLGTLSDPEPEVRRRLLMLISVEEYYRTMSYDKYEAWNIRSRHFANYVLDILQTREAKKGIVAWAHNSHVGDMGATHVDDGELTNFGQLMRKALGTDQVFILGSAGYSGTVLAASDWDQPVVEMEVPPAVQGSVESILNSGDWDNPLLLFENEEQRKAWSIPLYHRGIGVSYNPEVEDPDNYLITRIGMRYDALVFWKKSRALQLMVDP